MFKRAKLSVTRRKTKTIIFFLFLFIVANLVLSSISIKNATEESMKLARKSLGSEVILSTDMEKLREEFTPPSEDENSSSEDKKTQMENMHQKMDESNATISDVNKLKEISYVSDVKYYFSVNATEKSFSLYSKTTEENTNARGPMGHNNNSLQVEAINTFKLEDKYVNGEIKLIEGEAFEENAENVAIISYELATNNNLSLNDTITLTDTNSQEHTLTIVGIYQNEENGGFNNNYNLIYTNIKTGETFLTEEEYNNGNYSISKAVFYLDDPENADKFIKEANKLVTDFSDRYLSLDIDNQTYNQMISQIEGVATFSNTILIIVTIAAIVVISLMVVNSLKDRNYEIGVLLSLGEKKKKIVGQLIVELVLIATLAFILSIGTSMLTSQKLADTLIKNQSQSQEVINQGPMGGRGSSFNQNNLSNRKGLNSLIKNDKTIDSVDVSVTLTDIGVLFIIGYSIILVSMILPSIKILNSDPKDILSRKE